ncbi:hypothetical protein CNR22_00235 [Sphingobacteriaceae bacterium]|nr:hypothetical protein CNR22_00235 [Sphingobacteriaceae bacterium]
MQNRVSSYPTLVRINHIVLSVFLAVFFIYAGVKKFIPKPPLNKPVSNEAFVKAFEENKFESPVTFKMAIKALKTSGFLKMVGVLQILAGLLIILPPSRLIGLLMLLPLTVNVFCFHFFMDNRPDENIETGFLFLLNVMLLVFYSDRLKNLFIKDWSFKIAKAV